MQEALQKLGFYSGEEDMEFSSFSSGTERAVKTWQASLDAPQDGIVTAELEQLYTVAQIEGPDEYSDCYTQDMHPGNIPVRLAQSKSSRKRLFKTKPHVIFLDLGTTAELSKSDKSDFKAVALRDGRTAAECTLKLSKQHKCPDPKAFIEQVEEAFAFWGTPEADLVHPAEYMQQLLEKVRRHRVNVCTFMVTTLALEGWLQKLDPGYYLQHFVRNSFGKLI
ncbi:uncharacterized protein LOC18793217 isoform X1 [Prunus persica]|uniref:uncharacterized protein LOC18793217 isoform X1 n=2 Tax=Prunus persica TaxID=3760 RepID=UPI0009AB2025|nr:uncharacterized protein LOC18793217 isoform X1 [Prunus persica]